MAWITYDYRCGVCGITDTVMSKRDDVLESTECIDEECNGVMVRLTTANITRASYPDGVVDRWRYVKEKRRLKLADRAARLGGRNDDREKIKQELGRVEQSARKDKRSGDIVKVGDQK